MTNNWDDFEEWSIEQFEFIEECMYNLSLIEIENEGNIL